MENPESSFLRLVARDLLSRFGNDLADVAVIFPSRRARLFFNNHLYEEAQTTVWAPQYYSIEELFEQTTTLRSADSIQLICELYKTYIEVHDLHSGTPSQESLDEFYFFGEILLNDFDEIDKNLVNAYSLFTNLQDLDQLRDDFSHLSAEQLETLSRYFKHVFQGDTTLKAAFWSVWNILGEVYLKLKERLVQKQIAYPGMMMRSAIENESAVYNCKNYVFAGFNVLNQCEDKLFWKLREKALFYWDFDTYYLNQDKHSLNDTGRYIAANIRRFGSALDMDRFDNFLSRDKKITIISSPSSSEQSAALSPWIDSLKDSGAFVEPDSAIVLCDENLLPVVMHSIPPEKVENVNITMGFPITQSPICSFLQALAEMQIKAYVNSGKAFRYKYVLPVLRHPYTRLIFPEAEQIEKNLVQNNIFFPTQENLPDTGIFRYTSNTKELAEYLIELLKRIGNTYASEKNQEDIYNDLYRESIFRAYQVINRLYGLITSGDLNIEKSTFFRLTNKLFSVTKIPFHGEPVRGLQIMGVLETRCLDFKNLILLNVNEGSMPGTENDNSFIPQFLRKHFGLSTVEHQDSIYSYYFYRLIQRAEKITLVFNTDKNQTGKAEMSRFLLQLLIDSRLSIQRFSLQSAINPIQNDEIQIQKTAELIHKIRLLYDLNVNPEAKMLSPSALNTFIDCSLLFYLRYIEGLREQEELSDELDSSVFGTIFHKSAELLYREIGRIDPQKEFSPFTVQKEHFDVYIQHEYRIDRLINQAFTSEYFKGRTVDISQFNGEQLINFRVIRHLMKRLIDFDCQQTPFIIQGLEYPISASIELPTANACLKIGGIIDRLQEKDGVIQILDYKTSGTGKPFKTMEDLVTPKERRAAHVFQLFTYSTAWIEKIKKQSPVVPEILYLQEAGKEDYSPVIPFDKEPIADFSQLKSDFWMQFDKKISELFDPEVPFSQTVVASKCSYCDFRNLCNR